MEIFVLGISEKLERANLSSVDEGREIAGNT